MLFGSLSFDKLFKGQEFFYYFNLFIIFRLINMQLTSSLSLGKYFIVGKLCTFTSSNSLAVESILATTISSLSLYFSPNSSQIGANCLQCPHHGASIIQNEFMMNINQIKDFLLLLKLGKKN